MKLFLKITWIVKNQLSTTIKFPFLIACMSLMSSFNLGSAISRRHPLTPIFISLRSVWHLLTILIYASLSTYISLMSSSSTGNKILTFRFHETSIHLLLFICEFFNFWYKKFFKARACCWRMAYSLWLSSSRYSSSLLVWASSITLISLKYVSLICFVTWKLLDDVFKISCMFD